MRSVTSIFALTISGVLSTTLQAEVILEHLGDMGISVEDSTRDGVPDLVFRDTESGEVVIIYMHQGLDRPLRPSDLNPEGGMFYGQGTIGALDVLDPTTEFDRDSQTGTLVVDNWGTGGTGFEGTWNVTGPVIEVEILNGGTGYHEGGLGFFDIDATGTGGSGLDLAYGTLAGTEGEVRKVVIVDGGAGYTPGAELTLMNSVLDPEGVPFVGTAHVNESGSIFQVDIIERGEGFESSPDLMILDPGNGFGGEFLAFLAGAIDTVLILDGGADYAEDPGLTPQGPGEGFEYRIVRRGPITATEITNPGGGYDAAPVVAMDDLDFGAVLQPVLWEDLPAGDRPLEDQTGRIEVVRTSGEAAPLVQGSSNKWNMYPTDIDGDGDLDFMWRRAWLEKDNQRMLIWLMDGGRLAETINLDAPGKNWTPWKFADLNDDWKEDLLWWNASSGGLVAWNINPALPGNVGPEVWYTDSGGSQPEDWRPWVVRQGHADEGDQLVWRGKGNDQRLRLTDYIERNGELYATATVPQDATGAVVVPESRWKPWRSGDLNGDGVLGDIIGIDWSDRSLSVWQMNGSTWLGSGDLAAEREIKEMGRPRAIVSHDSGDITVGLTNGRLVTLGATGQDVPTASDDEQASLQAVADALAQATDVASVNAAITELDSILSSTPALVPYLEQPRIAHTLFGELSAYIRHEISRTLFARRPWTAALVSDTYNIKDYVAVNMNGVVSDATPDLQPLPDDDDSDGGSGSNGSGGSPSGGGSDDGSDGSDDLNGGHNDSGSGGSDTFDPCDFDINDPSTWPPDVDTEAEAEEWLLANIFELVDC